MTHWISTFTVYTLLLYNLLLGNNNLGVSQGIDLQLQQLNTPSISAQNTTLENKKEDNGRFSEIVEDTTRLDGLFTIYRRLSDDEIFLEIKPKQLNKNYLATVTMESGIGENGLYSGTPLQDFLFYFRRVNNSIQFVIRNVKFRTDTNKPEQLALARSFSDSVLYALPIVSIDSKSETILVNLGDLLMQDFPGLTSLLKYSLQANYRLQKDKSYFGNVSSFPLNLEIDSIYNFSSPEGADLITLADSRALTLKVHYSFSQLPENNGYIPRLADERVGYFITAYQDFSNPNPTETFVRYINRWYLEPSDPNAPLSPPKKPIVFWIENAVPLEYRDTIREGVLMWNRAFEKIGFKNAIEVRQMPDNADWNPADVRYNTIRWFNSVDAFFAKAPARVNPLTGEILDADIIIDANMLRSLQEEYSMMMDANPLGSNGLSSQVCNNLAEGNLSASKKQLPAHLMQLLEDDSLCYGRESSLQAATGATALSILHNVAPNSNEMKEYINQYLRSLISHEVGHALGLRHNFHGSTMLDPQELNNTEITHNKGLVSSVMDYLPVNIAPVGVAQGDYFPAIIGPYDEWAIEYGYKPNSNLTVAGVIPEAEKLFLEAIVLESSQPELAYATDEDILDINPDANVWDMSSDVLLYSQWQMDNARLMWERLEKRQLSPGESYSQLRVFFDRVLNYYFRNAKLIAQYIGGQSFRRNPTADINGWAFVPVTLEKQREVLVTLDKYVFAEDAFIFSPELLNKLAPSRWQHWGNPIPISRLDYPIHERILRLQRTILRSLLNGERLERLLDIELKTPIGEALTIPELFSTLQNSIWTEVLNDGEIQPISSIRRSLQREYLNILLAMVLRTADVPSDGRTLAWYELRQLQKAIDNSLQKQGENLDIYTLAHLEETSDRITKAFNAPLQSE